MLALTEAQLVPNILDPVASDTVPEGQFVSADPAVGTEVEVGETVNVAFSSGPNAVEVPDVTGQSQDQAAAALRAAGLEVGQVTEENADASVDVGDVIRSDPAAGATAAPGAAVALFIASPNVDLPELVQKQEAEASEILRSLDLGVRIETMPSGDFEPGTVLEQSRPAGVVERGETITLIVATEAPEAVTPEPTETPTDEGGNGSPTDAGTDGDTGSSGRGNGRGDGGDNQD